MPKPKRKPVKFRMTTETMDGDVKEETTFAYDAVGAVLYLLEKHGVDGVNTKTILVEPA